MLRFFQVTHNLAETFSYVWILLLHILGQKTVHLDLAPSPIAPPPPSPNHKPEGSIDEVSSTNNGSTNPFT